MSFEACSGRKMASRRRQPAREVSASFHGCLRHAKRRMIQFICHKVSPAIIALLLAVRRLHLHTVLVQLRHSLDRRARK